MPEALSTRELVDEVLAAFAEVGNDFAAAVDSEQFRARAEELLANDAEVVYLVPTGGFVGDMSGPWIGAEGLLAGFSEWARTFDRFRFEPDEILEAADGAILVLSTAFATLPGSSAVVEQKAAGLYRAVNGRLTRIELFLDQEQARRSAGLR
jgi:ketosteroid isomerase-like protein